MLITSEHWVSVARDDAVELANLLVVFFAFSRAATFLVKAFAVLIRLDVDSLQEDIELITSFSYFLHLLKADIHFASPFVTSVDSSVKLQLLTFSRDVARLESNQQEQAAAPLFPIHSLTCFVEFFG